ncbi:unnamed protein product [Cylicocyclus nassatus]|uniref:BTB domain-containing protein n=1 Tax=Cylicocyclus nassatus TaxID=53992 RepID=A0AA36HGR4_CYLNA|nr:unnamed protein product [Cylicocyclus nassatus]
MVVVNVGGKRFHTSLETLMSCPGANDEKLCLDYSTEEIFIDRDPKMFGYILNYLRDGRVHVPKNGHVIALLLQEAVFYGLGTLAERLHNELRLFHDYITIDAEESGGAREPEEAETSRLSSSIHSQHSSGDVSESAMYSDTCED